MIHILRAKNKQFYRVNTAHNFEPLGDIETVKTKKSVIKNILSDWKENFNGGAHPEDSIFFQDDTLKVPAVFFIFADGKILPATNVQLRHINPKIKK